MSASRACDARAISAERPRQRPFSMLRRRSDAALLEPVALPRRAPRAPSNRIIVQRAEELPRAIAQPLDVVLRARRRASAIGNQFAPSARRRRAPDRRPGSC